MAGLLEVAVSSIELLNDVQLTDVLKRLLNLEARSAGIAQRAVEVSLNIDVSDGGEDGRIEWKGGPDSTNYLPHRLVQFQVKATRMGPRVCANELVDNRGKLKPMVEGALAAGGSYVLFTNCPLNKQQKSARIAAIRKKSSDLKKPYTETAIIDVYDANRIQDWVNTYLPAVAAVANWVNRPLVAGMRAWPEWSRGQEYAQFAFVADGSRVEAIEQLRREMASPRSVARIIGLSGLGKTRLALELFRPTDEQDSLSQQVVYIDASDGGTSLVNHVSDWVRSKREGIVVVDNCELGLHKRLAAQFQRTDSQLSLLTLDYNPERDTATRTIDLKRLDDRHIKQMLEPNYKDTIPDLDRIVSFAQGFPQMAVLLADARLNEHPEMGSLTDDDLLKKMLWGAGLQNEAALQAICGCALFETFGLSDDAGAECEFIAENVSTLAVNEFHRHVMAFKHRGIIDIRGRYGQVIPKPLAVRLAADWWRRIRPEKAADLIGKPMPGRLLHSFCSRVSTLDFLPDVRKLTQDVCGVQGPFGRAEVILSDRGSLLFRAFVEVNPQATAEALRRVLGILSKEDLLRLDGDIRQNLVWSLEKLCFRRETFPVAARLLLRLAAAENERWSNNATDQFEQLFSTYLSGTEAPPEMRLDIADEALGSNDPDQQALGVKALSRALRTHHFSRTGGAEQQGSGIPLQDWRPKTWGEAFEYWEAALERLTALVLREGELKVIAKSAIASSIRGLMLYGRVNALDQALHRIVEHDGPLWAEALDSVQVSLHYDSNRVPPEGRKKLEEWIRLLQPKVLRERLRLFVSTPPYEREKDENGHYVDLAAEKAKQLAQECASTVDELVKNLDVLLVGEQRQGYIFGRTIVERVPDPAELARNAMRVLEDVQDANPIVLAGMLEVLRDRDRKAWDELVDHAATSKTLRRHYANLIRLSHPELRHLKVLLRLIRDAKLGVEVCRAFTYNRVIAHLSPDEISVWVTDLLCFQPEGPWVALDILSMYCHDDEAKWKASVDTFKSVLTEIRLSGDSGRGMMDFHHWERAVTKILEDEDGEFAELIIKKILATVSDKLPYANLEHNVKPVLRVLLRSYPKRAWPLFSAAISAADASGRFHLEHMLSATNRPEQEISILQELPDELLLEWCRSNSEFAPTFLARVIPVTVNVDGRWALHPLARALVDQFGDNEKVLQALSANMGTFSWSGSLVPYYRRQEEALLSLENHANPAVRAWVAQSLAFVTRHIQQESRADEEHDWGIY